MRQPLQTSAWYVPGWAGATCEVPHPHGWEREWDLASLTLSVGWDGISGAGMGRRDSWVTALPQWRAVRAPGEPPSHCLHQHGIRILSQRAGRNPWGWAGLGFGCFLQHGVSSSQKHEEEMARLRSDFEMQTKGQAMRQIPREHDRESCSWLPSSTLSRWRQVPPCSGQFSLPSFGHFFLPVLVSFPLQFWLISPTRGSGQFSPQVPAGFPPWICLVCPPILAGFPSQFQLIPPHMVLASFALVLAGFSPLPILVAFPPQFQPVFPQL